MQRVASERSGGLRASRLGTKQSLRVPLSPLVRFAEAPNIVDSFELLSAVDPTPSPAAGATSLAAGSSVDLSGTVSLAADSVPYPA